MNIPPKSQIWHVGLIPRPIAELTSAQAVRASSPTVVWLPRPGRWRYLADPFGVWHQSALHVFVEAYDYDTRQGVIEHHLYDANLDWQEAATCLQGEHHLSYPYVFEHDGEHFLVPESFNSGELALYRARRFPDAWERLTGLLPGTPAVDASLIEHAGLWWMFFALAGPARRDRRELHVAYAEHLTGPWQTHRQSPVVDDAGSARPGGRPWIASDGHVVLPVQDCRNVYGGAIRFRRFTSLTPECIESELVGERITGDLVSEVRIAGFHTLSGAGAVTLFDAKETRRDWGRWAVDVRRLWRQRARAARAR